MPKLFAAQRAEGATEKDSAAEELAEIFAKELEPLFTWDVVDGDSPFFGASKRLTLAEVRFSLFLGGGNLVPSTSSSKITTT